MEQRCWQGAAGERWRGSEGGTGLPENFPEKKYIFFKTFLFLGAGGLGESDETEANSH